MGREILRSKRSWERRDVLKSCKIVVERSGWYQNFSFFTYNSFIVVGRSDPTRQIEGFRYQYSLKYNPFTSIAPKCFWFFRWSVFDFFRSLIGPYLWMPITKAPYFLLKYETARPDRYAFQTLISQELLEKNGSKFNHLRVCGDEGGVFVLNIRQSLGKSDLWAIYRLTEILFFIHSVTLCSFGNFVLVIQKGRMDLILSPNKFWTYNLSD